MKKNLIFVLCFALFFISSNIQASEDVMLNVSVREGNFRDQADVESYSTQSPDRANTQYQTLVLDNHIAWIQSGQNIAPPPPNLPQNNNGDNQYSLNYVPVKSGFYILPHRIDEKHVSIKVSRYRQSLVEIGGSDINEQSLQTEVIVPINQWTKIAEVGNVETPKENSTVYNTDTVKNNISATYIKVTIVAN